MPETAGIDQGSSSMRARLTLAFFILALTLGLTACGQKGPLVLPPASGMAEQP